METQTEKIEPVTLTDVLNLATWSRERTSEELQSFITARHLALPDDIELDV